MRTGFEVFTGVGQDGHVAEKTEGDRGWPFPVGDKVGSLAGLKDYDSQHFLIKEEKMPDGKRKVILNDKQSGRISQVIR